MNSDLQEVYQSQLNHYYQRKTNYKKQLRTISLFRLLCFIAIFVSFYTILPYSILLALAAGISFLVIFLLLIKAYVKSTWKFKYFSQLHKVNEQELKAISGDYSFFEDGNAYVDKEHDYSFDLDLFGTGSLFQFINRTATSIGQQRLAMILQNGNMLKNKIVALQEAVNNLANKLKWRQEFIALGSFIQAGKDELINLQKWIRSGSLFKNKKKVVATAYILSAITICVVSLVIFQVLPYTFILTTILIQSIFYTMFAKQIGFFHARISKFSAFLNAYALLLKFVENEHWEAGFLSNLHQQIAKNNLASSEINKLAKLVGAFDTRLNFLLGFVLNWLVQWDIHCIDRLEKWKSKNKSDFDNWFNAIAEFDALQSLANFAFNHTNYVYPQIEEQNFILQAENIGHPLIPDKERIANNFSLQGDATFSIITGANMAGKSTFLRTVGVNYVLAMAGVPVCATKFVFSPVKLYSSMRTDDSLQRNKSYFFSELERLKAIFDKLQSGQKLFIILDEILKGTNSRDKEIGSKAFMRKLVKLNTNGIIATHDLSLGELANQLPENINNQCFEVQISHNELSFDYKLNPGITKNLNASYLMKKMGIV